jgi:hypothetical protein
MRKTILVVSCTLFVVAGLLKELTATQVAAVAPQEDKEFKFHNRTFKNQREFAVDLGLACGTKTPSRAQAERVQQKVNEFGQRNAAFATGRTKIVVPVYFHVIYDSPREKSIRRR